MISKKPFNRILIWTWAFSIIGSVPAFSQVQESYVPPSPGAASLGVYGEIPVSEYTGIPEISIPLYDIKADGFSLPVSLAYYAGGLHMDDEASWVGLGWTLNCGGVITRSKRGLDDFGPNGYYQVASSSIPCSDSYDHEPDIFYYNFGGYSGKFFIDAPSGGGSTYTIRKFTKDNISIVYQPGSGNWLVTTPDGVQYYFGQLELTTEVQKTNGAQTKSETYISSWFLTTITTVDGTAINFTYDQTSHRQTFKSYQSSVSTGLTGFSPYYANQTCCMGFMNFNQTITHFEDDVTADEVVLQGVSFPNGYIGFATSSRSDLLMANGSLPGRQLNKLIIYKGPDATYPEFKEYDLSYGLFNSQSGQPVYISTRLQLQSVTEVSGSLSKPPYSFVYNTNVVPDKGYSSTILGNLMGTTGLIQTITYPTGGTNTFTFELNSFTMNGSVDNDGGARIHEITATDPNNVTNVKRYEYPTGVLMGTFFNGMVLHTSTQQLVQNCCPDISASQYTLVTLNYQTSYSGDNSSLGDVGNGALIGYDWVTTYFGENGENGKTTDDYINIAPPSSSDPRLPSYFIAGTPVCVPPNISNQNGLLTDSYVYANNNGTFVLVKRTHNDFQSTGTTNVTAYRKVGGDCSTAAYSLTSQWIQQIDQIVYNYDNTGNNSLTQTTNFYYDNPNNVKPTRVQTADSKGNTLLTVNAYAQDVAATAGGVYTTMTNRNMIDAVLKQTRYKNGAFVGNMISSYNDWYNNGNIVKLASIATQEGSYPSETRVQEFGYDRSGNLLEFAKLNDEHISYLWGYNSMFPIAEALNASLQTQYEPQAVPLNTGSLLSLPSSPVTNLTTFTTNYAQSFSFSVTLTYNEPANDFGQVRVNITDSKGNFVYSNTYLGAGTFNGSASLQPGSYTISAQTNAFLAVSGNILNMNFSSTYQVARLHQDVFYTSFEEGPATSSITNADSKTGQRCLSQGPYNVIMPWSPGNYIVSWWQKPVAGGSWTYMEQTQNITGSGTPDLSIGSSSVMIDEVRVYPVGALLKTYTYDPLLGTTSQCDENNVVTSYQYDALGRLSCVLDQNKNIVKKYCYNYAGQPAACNQ